MAHQDKTPLNKVLFPLGDKPHKKCAPDFEHITLVGCIAADGSSVPASFIVKNKLNQQSQLEEHHLVLYPIYGNRSGFMDGSVLQWWVSTVFLPEVERRRILGDLPAVLV